MCQALLLLLSAVGSAKEIKLTASEREQLSHKLKTTKVVLMPNGEQRYAHGFVDPTDGLLIQALGPGQSDSTIEQHGESDINPLPPSSLQLFPPPAYLQSPNVMCGLRACGMKNLDDPGTFLAACQAVATAGQGSSEARSRAAASGLALFRLLISKWNQIGDRLSPSQLITLKRTPFVPCTDMRKLVLPTESIAPPKATWSAKVAALTRSKKKSGKRSGGSRVLLEEEYQLAQDVADDAIDPSASDERSTNDDMQRLLTSAAASIATWCSKLPPRGRSDLCAAAGASKRPRDTELPRDDSESRPSTCLVALSDRVCLERDAWLGWTQRLILPACTNSAHAVLHTLGVLSPPQPDVICRHLATTCKRWRSVFTHASVVAGPIFV